MIITIAAPASWAWRLRSAQMREPKCVVVTMTGTRPATCSSTACITCSRSASVSTNCSEKLARMQRPFEPASIMKSMQRRCPVEIELPTIVEDGRNDGENAAIGPLCSQGH